MGHGYNKYSYYRKTKRIRDETLPERIKECLKTFEKEKNHKLIEVSKSFLQQYTKYKGLSESQINYLASWEKKLNDPEEKKWKESWEGDVSGRALFKQAVNYYESQGEYYGAQVLNYLADPEGYCPTRLSHEKMTTNKYFRRYLKEKTAGPKFKSGDLVLGRDGGYGNTAGTLFLVLGETGKVDPCKGGRWYKAYCLVKTQSAWNRKCHYTVELREKEIKTFRSKR